LSSFKLSLHHCTQPPRCVTTTCAPYSVTTMTDLPCPVVFCGPSGVGKGTLIEMLMKRFPNDQFGFSVSHTTRKPRKGEVDGKHYNFTTVEEMKKQIDEGKFVEYAEVHGNYYGTSVAAVEVVQKENKICVLDIDVQGVMKVKESSLNPRYLFIAPPSMDELEKRLRGRGTETEEAITQRLANAARELEYGQTAGNFDRIFVNADLKATFEELASAFKEWYPTLDEVAPDDEQKNCTSKCAIS
jgi:guanylate kinase